MTSPKITEHIQRASLGAEVTLYQLDLTELGGEVFYFVAGDEGDLVTSVSFGGQEYVPFPIKVDGIERNTAGPLARPSLTLANVSGIFTPLVRQYDNLAGAIFTRLRTFAKFLDDGSDPDDTAILDHDVFQIRRKIQHRSKQYIAWELGASIDVANCEIPGRTIVRDFCDQAYRVGSSGGTFDYSDATCPYTGTAYFDENDVACAAPGDSCGKRLSSCKLRFGNGDLPFRGFPGAAKTRV